MNFFAKLNAAVERNQSLLCVGLDPNPAQLPDRYRQGDDLIAGILAWNKGIIRETSASVCCYKPNIAFYEALGAPGMELLRATLAAIPADIPVLLDAKRGDIGSTTAAYAQACFDDLGVDGVTLNPYLGWDSVEAFAAYGDKGLFVLCHTSNPSAREFQTLEINDWRTLDREPNQPLYIHVARTAAAWSPNVGLVVGATYPAAMADVRAAAPEAWFLVPGIGAQGGDLPGTLHAGLRTDGLGLIISASRSISLTDDHGAAAEALRQEIEVERLKIQDSRLESASLTSRSTISQSSNPQSPTFNLQSLLSSLTRLGAIKFGSFTLASGVESPIYIDLRLLVSEPKVLAQAAAAYAELLNGLRYERIAGVPYAALPIGTAVALAADAPLIYPRKEAKNYGLGKDIEGAWETGDRVVIIEDLITSGGSIIKTAERLRETGLIVEDAIILIDREQGGPENLAQAGITVHTVITLTDMLEILVNSGDLSPAKRDEVLAYTASSK
ncbi:MAG: orotidine-5'-phosphate decarboxylase [Caldilineaceae bacterium]|nr:orotidine-5'-phosphate decarboxylase [Caldilineaceae bacterium]